MGTHGGGDERLVGRATETGAVEELLQDVAGGRGRTLVVTGEAGIGKTSLLAHLLAAAADHGFIHALGRADEVDSERAFGTVTDLAEGATAFDRAALLAALRPDERLVLADRTLVVADALADTVEAAAAERPVVVVFEDVHWADAGSVAVIRRLARTVAAIPILLAVTTRPSPQRRDLELCLEEMAAAGGTVVGLDALPHDAVDELVRRRAGAAPGPRLRAYLAGCAGNPFYLLGLLGALETDRALETATGVVELAADHAAVPLSLRRTVLHQLGFLPADALRLLQLAALLGGTFSARNLAAVAGRPVRDLLDPLDHARRTGLVVDAGDRWAFRHDLVRLTLVDELAPTARQALHRDAAVALGRAGAPPAVVARHFALGAEPGDTEAIAALRAAAAEALRSSIPVGLELLESARALTLANDPARFEIVATMVDPLNASGRADEAEALAREALASPLPPLVEVTIVHALASTLYARGDMAAAIAVQAPYLDRPDLVGAPVAQLHAATAIFSLLALDLEATARHAAAALDAAVLDDDSYALGLASNTVAMSLLSQGRPDDALAPALAARDHLVDGSVYAWAAFNPPFTLAVVALERDDFDTALASLRRGRAELEACGNVSWLVQYGAIECLVPYLRGDLDGTEEACRIAQTLPLDFGPHYQQGVPAALLSIVATHRGDRPAAAALAEVAERHYLEHGPQLGIDLAWLATALVKEAAGDGDGAYEMLRLAWELTDPIHYLVSWRILAPEVIRLTAGRDPDFARHLVDATAEGARRNPSPSASATAVLVEGLATADADLIVEAVGHYDHSPRRLAAAAAATHAVRALRAADRRAEATHYYELARERFEAAGAEGDLDRLRRAGGRRRTGMVLRPTMGWESLTRSEREVVDLLQQGLTNRQIGDALGISRRTVETHLSHAFTKVGVSTRVQLAAEAAKLR